MGSLKKILKPPKPTLNPIKMAARITEATPMPGGLKRATARTNAWVQGKANHEYAGTGITRAPVAAPPPPPQFARIGGGPAVQPDWAAGGNFQRTGPVDYGFKVGGGPTAPVSAVNSVASKFKMPAPTMTAPPDSYWANPPRRIARSAPMPEGPAPAPQGQPFVPPPLVQGVEPTERWYGPQNNLTMQQEVNRQALEQQQNHGGGG